MATEQPPHPINGTYLPQQTQHHQAYSGGVQNHLSSHPQSHPAPSGPPPDAFGSQGANVASSNNGGSSNTDVPKDEVGWHFVEQYYTNLSKNPERLHLFYNRRSSLVWGTEGESVGVAQGRQEIADQIKSLNLDKCKVRVTNVDSQASTDGAIIIQVVGEMSDERSPNRKFVQTFFLAKQTNGYFVLNDIFRYLKDDEEDEEEYNVAGEELQPVGGAEETEAVVVPAVEEHATSANTIEEVGKKLEHIPLKDGAATLPAPGEDVAPEEPRAAEEHVASEAKEPAPTVNGTKTAESTEDDEAHVADKTPVDDLATTVESPKEPEPTRVATPSTPQKQPQGPPKPTAPKTWANLVAGSGAAASSAPAPVATPAAVPVATPSSAAPAQQGPAWQTAGPDATKRQSRPQSNAGGDEGVKLAYVKNVTEKVQADALRKALEKFGQLDYFDVSRQKNCAFVEFKTAAGYHAAVAANPHVINGDQIFVEERRPRAGAYNGAPYGRGASGSRGRGMPEGRPGSQGRGQFPQRGNEGGRGGYGPRGGRGGASTPKGRGTPVSS